MDSSLQAKQQYLREKILDAGYDAQNFVQFCSKTHDLDDLQNWSMNQLVQIVNNYLGSLNKNHSQHSQKQQHQPNDDFGHFQTIVTEHVNIQSHTNVPVSPSKMGLVFSDTDWNMFLSGPSVIKTETNTSVKITHNSQIPAAQFDFNELHSIPAQNKIELSQKDFPLSPPSIQNKTQETLQKPSVEPMTNVIAPQKLQEKAQRILSEAIKQKRQGNHQSNNPINLSNIKISTGKQKSLPALPSINDIRVIKTQQVARNFLQADYLLYHISFSPCQHVIQRKFADLRKARSILQKMFPFLRLPYLQPDGWVSSSQGKDSQSQLKFKWMIQQFFKYLILKSEELKNCELVRILCGFGVKGEKTQVSKEELKRKLDAYQNLVKPKFVGQILLSDNNIIIPPINNGERIVNNTLNLLTEIDLCYDKLKRQQQVLFYNYDLMIKSYSDISGTFESLQNLIKRYNMDNNEAREVRVYEGLKQMCIKLTNRTNQQYLIFKARIKNLFRYEKDNMATLKEVIDNRNRIHSQYVRQGLPSFTSNSMKIQGANVEVQSPIPLEQPIRSNRNTLSLQQIFWSYTCTREINRYWQHLRKKIAQHLTLIAYDQLDSENDNLNFWNTMIKKCVI